MLECGDGLRILGVVTPIHLMDVVRADQESRLRVTTSENLTQILYRSF